MEQISRRRFLKGSVALGTGAVLWLYGDGSYRMALANEQPAYRIRILHTNDHHARIEPVAGSDGQPLHGGVSRRKRLIDKIRAEAGMPTLLVDAGDVFQGTLYFNQFNGMADLEFYNVMGYELMTLGNHEFDKTQAALADFLTRASFPVLSANIIAPPTSPIAGKFLPSVVLTKGGEQLGFFGVSPQDTPELALGARELSFSDPIEAAKAQVAALQAQGVTKIFGLTHVGFDVDIQIARQVPGIAMIIGGHSHTPMMPMNGVDRPAYPELIAGPDGRPVVVVTDWEWGRWLGDVTVSFNAKGRVIDVQGRPIEVASGFEPDPGFEARINVFKRSLDELRKRVVGEAAVELNGNRADVRTKETNLGDLVAEALLVKAKGDGAQIALMNGGGIRTSIPAGPVTIGQILEVLPFGNTLALTTISGADLKQALENGVSQIESAAGRFPQIAGCRFSFNPALLPQQRVTSITVNDKPVDPKAMYRVATNNFMLVGGDGYTSLAAGSNKIDTGLIMADLVEQYITANSPVKLATDGRISQRTSGVQPVATPSRVPVGTPTRR